MRYDSGVILAQDWLEFFYYMLIPDLEKKENRV